MATEPRRQAPLGRALEAGEPGVRQTFFALAPKAEQTELLQVKPMSPICSLVRHGAFWPRPALSITSLVLEQLRPSLNPAAWEPAFSGAHAV